MKTELDDDQGQKLDCGSVGWGAYGALRFRLRRKADDAAIDFKPAGS